MITSRSVVRSRFLLAIATILSLLANHCTNAEEPRSFDSRKQDWEPRLDEFVKKPPPNMISDPLQSLDINNFAADCTVQMTYSPRKEMPMQFKFMKEGKELVSFPGHFKSVFGAKHNILVFVSYGRVRRYECHCVRPESGKRTMENGPGWDWFSYAFRLRERSKYADRGRGRSEFGRRNFGRGPRGGRELLGGPRPEKGELGNQTGLV